MAFAVTVAIQPEKRCIIPPYLKAAQVVLPHKLRRSRPADGTRCQGGPGHDGQVRLVISAYSPATGAHQRSATPLQRRDASDPASKPR